jgi:lipid II:glycine glycyltransferase (peptidoglycan interpeptide bridge formation enzyme)
MHTDSKLIEYIQANKEKEIIYIDLSLNEEDIWKNIRKGHKSSIKSGRKNGVVIEKVEATKSNIEILNKLYLETMQRNNADTRWFLPENYFSNCFSNLGTSRCSLFFAYKDAIPISASIFLHDFEIIYYHFSGSDSKYYSLNMNNLLVYEVCLWAKNKEYKYFHLGGGVTSYSNDSLYIFKSGFSDKTASLYSVQKIFDISKYSYLNKIKEKYELNNEGQIMNSDYFPLYRRKK